MRLSLPNVKQNFGKRTFLFTGAKFFNKLPLNIVKSEKNSNVLPPSKTFLFIITLILCYIIGLKCDLHCILRLFNVVLKFYYCIFMRLLNLIVQFLMETSLRAE